MTTANHIVGGLAITGISLSFWDINVLSDSTYLATCIFASILPDIDHKKSIIGKVFFPISNYLDKHFGHRTITHSLSVFIPLILLVLFIELNFINPLTGRSGNTYFLIFTFGYLSHLILDMLTVQGIPFFYPIMRNPCVIPANPTLRFRSGNLKSEAMALFFFTMVLVSAYDLFTNGFWTTYNRSFGTIKHISREFSRQKNILKVHYDFWKYNHHLSGDAFVINSDEYSTTFFKKDSLFFIRNNDNSIREVNLLPEKSNIPFSPKELSFNFIDIDSLNHILHNVILRAEIHSNSKFIYHGKIADKIELKYELHPIIDPIISDTTSPEDLKIDAEINRLNQKIQIARRLSNDQRKERKKLTDRSKYLNKELEKELDLYTKNKYENELIKIHEKLSKLLFKDFDSDLYYKQIDLLKKQKNKKNIQYYNGSVLYLDEDMFYKNKIAISDKLQ